MTYEYEGVRRIQYLSGATFVPVCPNCGRFVKAEEVAIMGKNGPDGPNATCAKCGEVTMPFEGYYDVEHSGD